MSRNLLTVFVAPFIIIFLTLTIGLRDVRGETTIVQTVNNGDSTTHIDLAIIGSGFTEDEIGTYILKADENIDKMFTVNWFADNSDLFNVYRIDAVSPESGIDLDDTTIYSISSQTPYDILIVLHNYDCQESVQKPYIELCRYSNNYVVLAHELGHIIGKLDDEYHGSGTAYRCNGLSKFTLNTHDKSSNEKWSDLISTAPYEGAGCCATGLWRPSENSIMKDSANTPYFDAVGYKAMDIGAGKILRTVESISPSLQISGVQNGDIKSGILNVEAITSDVSGIERVEFYWAKAGDTSKSIKIDRIYPYDLVVDTTQYENGQYYLDTVSYDKNWNYIRVTRLFNISNTDNTSDLDVSIIVHEALTQDTDYYIQTGKRQNMPGMDRINESLTVGIPLAEDSGITSISQLGLSEDFQQFRLLAYWPNGNIKWVLVDTQVNVAAEDQTIIHLENGTGNSGGIDLAVDSGDFISVDTGTAQFKIKKSNFNMIDKAVVNGEELVSQNNAGGLSITGYENTTYILHKDQTTHTLQEGVVYDSKNDFNSIAVIEENGPVRTVVKAMGAFKDTDGNRFMDYTVRLHFYKNKSYVKSQVIMRHGQEEEHPSAYSYAPNAFSQKVRTFSNMQISIPLNLDQGKQFEFSTNKGVYSGNIDSNAHIYQGSIYDSAEWWSKPPINKLTVDGKVVFEQTGFEIKNGQTVLHSLGDENDRTNNFAEIKDQNNNGLTVAMQYMSAYWPASIEFGSGGNTEIGVFSKFNSKEDIKMGWATHETRDMILDFHTSSINNQETIYRIKQPIVGRATIQYYGNTKTLFDQNGFPTAEEFNQWFVTNYGKIDYQHPKSGWEQSNMDVKPCRLIWYSGVQGSDYPLLYQLTFLKTGTGGRYMSGLQKTIFNSDSAIRRTDGFDYSESLVGSNYLYPSGGSSYNTGGGQNRFDMDHGHWRAMPFYYYMTGNEEIKEAINDHLEYIRKGESYLNGSGICLRTYSRYYNSLALGYEFNNDTRLKTILEKKTNELLDSRDDQPNTAPNGRNLNRGYFFFWIGGEWEPVIHSFFQYSIHIQDTWQGLRVLKEYDKNYSRIEELDDYLLGLAQFAYNEAFLVKPDGTNFGYVYDYSLNEANYWVNDSSTTGFSGNYMRRDDTSRGMLHAYYNTGDEKYLERGKKLLAFGGGSGSSTSYPAHDLIYADLYGIDSYWSYLNNVAKVNNGNNNYTLTWTVPEGAIDIKIKYSDKPIVDWLGFDQATREYEYSPDDYIAFFAATNIDNEPAPLAAGSVQSVVIDIEQAINSYNTVRNLTPDNPSYVSYDPNNTYYFAMKYEHSPESGDQANGLPSEDDGGDTLAEDGGDIPTEDDSDVLAEDGGDIPTEDDSDVKNDEIQGDLDGDGDIDRNDLNILLGYRDQPASACIACDLDGDGVITVLDARKLVIMCTRPMCSCE